VLTVETCPRLGIKAIKPNLVAHPGRSSVRVRLTTDAGVLGFNLAILRDRVTFGVRTFFGCPSCGKRRRFLYFLNAQLACRACLHVGYQAWTLPDSSWRSRVGRPALKARQKGVALAQGRFLQPETESIGAPQRH
jgi:hypothetical protein